MSRSTTWPYAASGPETPYPWSSRGITYEAEGYVHCASASQLAGIVDRYYGDRALDDLVLLELDLDRVQRPVVVEDLGSGEPFPHLYAPLTRSLVRAEHPVDELLGR